MLATVSKKLAMTAKIGSAAPCELRAPEDFLKWRYKLLDMSAMRVA